MGNKERKIIELTEDYVKNKLQGEATGHDWWHAYRVWRNAINISKKEGGNFFVIQLAALLHDIADWKFHGGDIKAGSRVARKWLMKLKVNKKVVDEVCEIIDNISFKGAGVNSTMKSKEGMIVQDADRLDAMGAIGIARVFAFGGSNGREIYNPMIKPTRHTSFEEYKKSAGSSINHFYEKLLLLKELMNTDTARKMAGERHEYMKEFLKRFFKEWNEGT